MKERVICPGCGAQIDLDTNRAQFPPDDEPEDTGDDDTGDDDEPATPPAPVRRSRFFR